MIELLILLIIVVGIVVSTAVWKIHPFLALLAAAFLAAFAYRLPTGEIVGTITEAFGGTLGGIGLVILFGTMIGIILERSGGAIAMADALIRIIGSRFPNLTMSLIGYIVSIPVFCDSGYVILNSLRKAISVRTGISFVSTSIALMTGLYATHTLVPPTPGPLAAAENLRVTDSLGLLILIGLPIAAVAALAALAYASLFANREFEMLPPENEDDITDQSYDELRASYGQLPSAFAAFLPILVPLVLICVGTVAALPAEPFGTGRAFTVISFVGTPVIALILGLATALILLRGNGKLATFNEQIHDSIRVAAPILLITGAGAAFGGVLGESALTDVLEDNLSELGLGLLVPFLISAALKTAQGSSTVALVTSSSMMFPLLGSLGLDSTEGAILSVLAIGAGSMVVSHANDSFFWVVAQLSRIPVATAFRTLTVATAVEGVAAFGAIWVASLFLL